MPEVLRVTEMTWEQKFAALKALDGRGLGVSLKMRQPGNWYVSLSAEIVDGGLLVGPTQAAPTPQAAIEQCWESYAAIDAIVRISTTPERRVTWNGFMWDEVPR